MHEMFYEDGGAGQVSLRRVLTWYAALDPEVGYCQGMGFIAALLLSYMIEEDAFYCLYAVLTVSVASMDIILLSEHSNMLSVLLTAPQCPPAVTLPPAHGGDAKSTVRVRRAGQAALGSPVAAPGGGGHPLHHVRANLLTLSLTTSSSPPTYTHSPYLFCRYFTEWALTLFSRGFSFDLVTRVWDVLMNEGSYKIVYRVSLALLKVRTPCCCSCSSSLAYS